MKNLFQRSFYWYFKSQTLNLITAGMQASIVTWFVFDLTKSTTYVAMAQFSFQLFSVFSSPLAGKLNDRMSKPNIIATVSAFNSLLAFVFAYFIFQDKVTFPFLLVFYSLVGLLFGIEIVSRFSYIGETSSELKMHRNIGFAGALSNLARIAGPALGAVFVSIGGYAGCIFLHSAICMLNSFIVKALSPKKDSPAVSKAEISPETHIGFPLFMKDKKVYSLLGYLGFVAIMSFGIILHLPEMTRTFFSESTYYNYVFINLSFAIGSLVGSLMISDISDLNKLIRKMSLHVLVASVCFIVLANTTSIPVVTICLFAAGYAMTSLFPQVNSFLNKHVMKESRGKIMGIYSTATTSAAAIAVFIHGVLSETMSQSSIFTLLSLLGLMVAITYWFQFARSLASAEK